VRHEQSQGGDAVPDLDNNATPIAADNTPGADEPIASDSATEEERRRERHRMIAAIAATLLIGLVLFITWLLLQRTAVVPDVVGLPQDEAVATIERVGLPVGEVTTSTNTSVKAGEVGFQSPPGEARVIRGTPVNIDISVAIGSVVLDRDGIGQSQGYRLGLDEEYTREAIGSDANPSQMDTPKTTADTLPSVQGMTRSQAAATLEAAGYGATFKSGASTTGVAAGIAYAQEPAPESSVARGTKVTVWMSTGAPENGWPYTRPSDGN
jgi:serine/threonine-protein kinase